MYKFHFSDIFLIVGLSLLIVGNAVIQHQHPQGANEPRSSRPSHEVRSASR